jgi:hypothetical protein
MIFYKDNKEVIKEGETKNYNNMNKKSTSKNLFYYKKKRRVTAFL